MNQLSLHEFHHSLGARFGGLNGAELVSDYGDALAEHTALTQTAGVIDLSFRGRVCLTGADRIRFLHGQVTNDIKRLRAGEGCYAALVTAKGKMESDLNIWNLADELLLDFEPGLTERISQRLEKYIIADDVQVVDVAPHYGLLSVQGPKADAVVRALGIFSELPEKPFSFVKISDAMLGEIYLMNHARVFNLGRSRGNEAQTERLETPHVISYGAGFDLFIPTDSLGAVADKLIAAAKQLGGRATGWTAFEMARIESGIPRFGADMDETNIPLECGIEERAVSYSKGCYIGQEVINRIHSIGHVNRALRLATIAPGTDVLPQKGDRLFHNGKEVGYVTSAVKSPAFNAVIALGYVHREANAEGTKLSLTVSGREIAVEILGASGPKP